MHKRIKAENEIHRRVGNHGQGAAVVHVAADIRNTRKTLLARFDTFTRLINGPELVAVVLQVMRPPPESRRDFQDRAGWQALTNTRKDCARPLRSGTAPRGRPFLTCLSPIVLHFDRSWSNHSTTVSPSEPKNGASGASDMDCQAAQGSGE